MRRALAFRAVRSIHRTVGLRSSADPKPTSDETTDYERKRQLQTDETMPVEKKSLASGLALNRIDKDFVIFPEYDQDAELDHIKQYIYDLGLDLDKVLGQPEPDKGALEEVLRTHMVYGAAVPAVYGGLGSSKKDLVQLNELLGQKDLSLFANVAQQHLAAHLLRNYATPQQRDDYLPRMAAGEIKVALCFLDDNAATASYTKVNSYNARDGLLSGKKINVHDAQNADYFLVIARNEVGPTKDLFCYIIPKQPKAGKVKISPPKKTQGLNGAILDNDQVCGSVANTHDMVNDFATANRINHGAAAVGCLKKVMADLVRFAHDKRLGNQLLAENPSVQASLNNLGLNVFVLETMVFYLAGMADDSLFPLNDVENQIAQRLANRALRQGILSIAEVADLDGVDTDLDYAQRIKDITTILAMSLPELSLVRSIALPTIDSYVKGCKEPLNISKFLTPKNVFFSRTVDQDYTDARAIHFLAEHADPELESVCRELELSTFRLSKILKKVCVNYATQLQTDYYTQQALADILELQLGMAATIARSTRAAAVGLTSGIAQVGWTQYYCERARRKAEVKTEILKSYFELAVTNPSIIHQGKLVLNEKGYPMDSPVERNW